MVIKLKKLVDKETITEASAKTGWKTIPCL